MQLILSRLSLLALILILAGPAQSLDFSGDLLVYREDFEGEISFPTTPEVDQIAVGGLLGGSDPGLLGPPPPLTGTSVHESASDTTTIVEAVLFVSSSLGTDSFSSRGEFSGLSVPEDMSAGLSINFLFPAVPPEGFPSIAVNVGLDGGNTSFSIPAAASILVAETDGMGLFPSVNSVELSLPAAETVALLGGAAFVLDLRADRVAETVTASIDITGFPTHTVGPMPLLLIDDAAEVFAMTQGLFLVSSFAAPPGTLVEVDLDAFEIYLPPPPVPALSPGSISLLAALLLGTAWSQGGRWRPRRSSDGAAAGLS